MSILWVHRMALLPQGRMQFDSLGMRLAIVDIYQLQRKTTLAGARMHTKVKLVLLIC